MKKNWFTLVEILIVIVIFGIGILGILTLMSHSIGYFDRINMQTRATFLAKEALDLSFHYRDNNLIQGYPRNYYDYQNDKEVYFGDEGYSTFKVWFHPDQNSILFEAVKTENTDPDNLFTSFLLTLKTEDTLSFYSYDTPGEQESISKGFARRVSFEPVKIDADTHFPTNKLLKITAHTLYKRGERIWEVKLSSLIGLKDSVLE